MNKQILMAKGAKNIVEINLKVKEGETVAIVTESRQKNIAEVLASAVVAVGGEPTIHYIMPRKLDGEEPPKSIAAVLENTDAFIAAVYTSITHTFAVHNAVKKGKRGLVLTQFNEDQLINGGVFADFPAAAENCRKVAKILENAETIRVTSKHGTNMIMSAKGRRGNALIGMVENGQFSTCPTIEANTSPLEGTANGRIVCNASIPYIGIGLLKDNVTVDVKNGFIIPESIKGGQEAKILAENWKAMEDPNVYNIAEIGIGLNPKCVFVGSMLEDEGVFGSLHFGIGTSIALGGKVKSKCHYDLIQTDVTVEVDGRIILKDSELMI